MSRPIKVVGVDSAPLKPEIQVLQCCARVRIEPERVEQLKALLDGGVDWPYLMRMADRHRVRPLLFHHLNGICPETVPSAILSELQERFQGNFHRNLRLARELCNLVGKLGAEGIPAIPLKGPALTLALYGHLGLREFADLDVHVDASHLERVVEVLRSAGYRRPLQLQPAQESAYIHNMSEFAFHNREEDVLLEIHWRFESRYFSFLLEAGTLKDRMESLRVGGMEMTTYGPEDQFLLLSVHGGKHLWWRLRWICDLSELLRSRKEFDWSRLFFQARKVGVERMVLLGACLANRLLDAPIPADVARRIAADSTLDNLANQVIGRLGDEDSVPEMIKHVSFHLRSRERLRDRVRYCFRLAVTPTPDDLLAFSLPPAASPLYYAIRPFRLGAKYWLRSSRV